MTRPEQPKGIDGLEGREPIEAAFTVGRKDPQRGHPIDKDRFYVHVVNVDESGGRPMHPSFALYNNAPADRRKTIHGNLIHSRREQCFELHLKAQKLKGYPATPKKEPACVGDGKTAIRYLGPEKGFEKIKCPNDLCEFRQCDPPACKPWMRFLFRPSWPKNDDVAESKRLPSPFSKLTSMGWNTTANFLGFFNRIEAIAKELGIESPNLFGLPFIMSITEKTNKDKKTRFPVVTISPDGDLVEFFMAQRHRQEALDGLRPVAALTDESEQDPDVVSADYRSVTPGKYEPQTEEYGDDLIGDRT